jgi:lipopolysaccharide export system protein LptA
MQIRKALRLVFLAIAVAVAAVVYLQWQPAGGDVPEQRPQVEMPEDRGVQSVTRALNVIQSSNGRPVFRIGADEHVDFEDGWNVWDRVRMDLYGVDAEAESDDVQIVGDRMRTSGDIGKFAEIRIIGNVVVDLPGSGHFETRRIDYDAVSGLVSNCNRNVLTYAGLEVVSNCLEFRTRGDLSTGEALQADDLRMWGELSIRSVDEGAGALPSDLRGGGAELRFQPGDEFVYLDGEPFLDLGSAVVRSDALTLNVGQNARQLTGVDAQGAARLRVREQGAVADEAGNVADSERDLVVRAQAIRIDLDDETELAGLVAESDQADPSALVLPDLGVLRGVTIELQPATELEAQRVTVDGEVSWEPGASAGGLRYLGTDRLELELDESGPRQLAASGSVLAALEAAEGEVREFTGEEMALAWDDDGALASGTWPQGVRFTAAGERSLEAGSATYSPATSSWRLSGDPQPTVTDPQLSLGATSMAIGDDGSLRATGGVTGTMGGASLAAAAVLFGGVEEVRVRAGEARIDPAGPVDLGGRVEVVWEEQSLVAGSLRLETDPGRLRAQREVELVAVEGGEAEGFVTVTADNLLVEEETSEIRLAGQALLRRGDRQIQADKLTVAIGDDGTWSNVLAEDNVAYRDPQGEASGETLLYDLQTSEILLTGSEEKPAIFRLDDLEYASTEALRILFEDEQVVIEATEAGRTRTSVVPREGGISGAQAP